MRKLCAATVLAMAWTLLPAALAGADVDQCAFPQTTLFPGDSVTIHCEAVNNEIVDATFLYFVKQDSIQVFNGNGDVVTGPDADTFLGFFRLALRTQPVLAARFPPGQDPPREADDIDIAKLPRDLYRGMCADRRLTELTGDPANLDATHCRIGRVRARERPVPVGGFDRRGFELRLTMLDQGDQTAFAGWGIGFTHVFRALVAALNDCPNHCGVDLGAVYER